MTHIHHARTVAARLVRPALLALALSPALLGAAQANRAAGDACAAGLNADGKAIYAATLPTLAPGADLRAAVTETTRSLAMAGTINRDTAKTSAQAAGKCLMMSQS